MTDRLLAALRRATTETNRSPTPAQAEAGNYRKGRVRVYGLEIAIEQPKGSWRTKHNADGSVRWTAKMPAHYGYFVGQMGADGDQLDVYLGPDLKSDRVFVVDQHKGDQHDEHKVILGVRTLGQATAIYDAGFSDGSGPGRRAAVTELSVGALKAWIAGGGAAKPLAKLFDDSKHPRDVMGRWVAANSGALSNAGVGAILGGIGGSVLGAIAGAVRGRGKGALIGTAVGAGLGAVSLGGLEGYRTASGVAALETESRPDDAPSLRGERVSGKQLRGIAMDANQRGIERSISLDGDRRVSMDHFGDANSVGAHNANTRRREAAIGAAGIRNVHNHPGDLPQGPSYADIGVAIQTGSPMTIYSAGGSMFRVRPLVRGIESGYEVGEAYKRTYDEVMKGLKPVYGRSKTMRNMAGVSVIHGLNLGAAEAGLINYSYRFADSDKKYFIVPKIAEMTRKAFVAHINKHGKIEDGTYAPLAKAFNEADHPRKVAADRLRAAFDVKRTKDFSKADLAKADDGRPADTEKKLTISVGKALTAMKAAANDNIGAAGDSAAGHLLPALDPLDAAFRRGARAANTNLAPEPRINVDFDLDSPEVKAAIDGYKLDLIREIDAKQRDAVRAALTTGLADGLPPAEMARRIRESIGLTATQAQHVTNYRSELESGNPIFLARSLQRALRDKRYDPTVNKAIDGKELSDDQIDKMVDAYQRRYLAYRAMTIARTEAVRAENLGGEAAIQVAIDGGQIPEGYEVRKTWITRMDGKERESHRELNGQTVPFDEPYQLPDGGTIMRPHDPAAPARETVNCRCAQAFKLVRKEADDAPVA